MYARSTVEVRSRYPQSTLWSHLLRKELQPRLRRERAEKLARMARLLQPTEPRPPAAQCASLELGLLVFHSQYSPMTCSLLPRRSLMVCSWFAHGSVTVRSLYARSSLLVLSQYGVGMVLLWCGTLIYIFSAVLYT